MSPRKRVKPSSAQASSTPSTTTSQTSDAGSQPREQQQPPLATEGSSTPAAPQEMERSDASSIMSRRDAKQVHKTRSWYGSWPRAPKSTTSTQVTRETIHGGTLKPHSIPDFSRFDTKKSGGDEASITGTSSSTTTLPRIQENAGDGQREDNKGPEDVKQAAALEAVDKDTAVSTQGEGPQGGSPPVPAEGVSQTTEERPTAPATQQPQAPSAWLGWLARSNPTPAKPDESVPSPSNPPKETGQEQQQPAVPDTAQEPPQAPEAAPVSATPATQGTAASGASWFSFWGSSATAPPKPTDGAQTAEAANETANETPKEAEDVVMQDAPPAEPEPTPPAKGSTWAFWSRDSRPKADQKPAGSSPAQSEAGELAVMGEGSESHPQRTKSVDVDRTSTQALPGVEGQAKEPRLRDKAGKKSKRLRPQSMDLDEPVSDRFETPKSETSSLQGDPSAKAGPVKAPVVAKTVPSNLLLPAFTGTYRLKDNPSIMKQIAQLLLRTQQPPANHVFLTKDPPKIKKALAIGVHGLFPATYLRAMVGQPTGTSIKFANHCAEGIRRWADSHGCEDCEIEKVALEGEGKIGERVENLWKLLLNWIDHIRSADLIVVACHSQGVPVSIMLVAKLIELGIITTARIGVCAMAGVSLGPFPDYKSGMGILMGSAAELYEFANPESEISKRYESSLKAVLKYGVRVTYIGSIDDQLVPMESSIYSLAHHPYIYRAVFIDGRIHAPDFIAHLVGFALKLRNLGISDHGLIRELSVPLAGSLYGGEGHSRLYDDPQVYDLAIAHTLETTDVGDAPCTIKKYEGLANPNPYHLPWIMRGLLEEDFVKTELSVETAELLRQFDDWKPTTKALKDVKYRLEVVRSKL